MALPAMAAAATRIPRGGPDHRGRSGGCAAVRRADRRPSRTRSSRSRQATSVDVLARRALRHDRPPAELVPLRLGREAGGDRRALGLRGRRRGWLLTRAIARPRGPVHQADYYRYLVACARHRRSGLRCRRSVPARRPSRARTSMLRRTASAPDGRSSASRPGAAYGHAKRWPPRRVAEVVRMLTREPGATCVLVGAAGDRDAGREIESALPPGVRVVNLIGRTDLRVLIGVAEPMRRVRLQRFGRDAPGGRRRRAGDGDLRPDRRARDRANRRSRRARPSGLLPALHAARLPDRSPLHERHHRRDGRSDASRARLARVRHDARPSSSIATAR